MMVQPTAHDARLLLIGRPGGELRSAAELARASGAQVAQADNVDAALDLARRQGGDLAMVDVDLDIASFITALRRERIAMPVLACGIDASAERAVAAIRAGARDYVPLPPDRDLIAAAITSVTTRSVPVIGRDAAFRRALDYAGAMARGQAPLLVRGAAGTGKELIARTIHQASGRTGPFVSVECEGVEAEELESELFGHVANAFDGAVAERLGKLAEAARGTLYLREVTRLPPALQARLAETLSTARVRAMGADSSAPLTARLIAGSRIDLRQAVKDGHFRADLSHRLALAEIVLPPLRDRMGDMEALARYFAQAASQENALSPREPDAAALALLARHDWPENVRELEAVMHRAVLLSPGQTVSPAALVLADGRQMGAACAIPRAAEEAVGMDAMVGRTVGDVERDLILRTLDHCGGNRTSASSILGISVRTMRNKLREFAQAGYAI